MKQRYLVEKVPYKTPTGGKMSQDLVRLLKKIEKD